MTNSRHLHTCATEKIKEKLHKLTVNTLNRFSVSFLFSYIVIVALPWQQNRKRKRVSNTLNILPPAILPQHGILLLLLWRHELLFLWRDKLVLLWRDELVLLWRGELLFLWRVSTVKYSKNSENKTEKGGGEG